MNKEWYYYEETGSLSINVCARNCTMIFRYGISLDFQQGMRNIGTEDILEKSFRYLLILKRLKII